MEDTWLFLIGLDKLPTNFPRQLRSHLFYLTDMCVYIYIRCSTTVMVSGKGEERKCACM